MMQIHTTQNLSALAQQQISTNSVSSKEFRFIQNKSTLRSCPSDSYACSISFGASKPSSESVNKIKRFIKKLKNIKVGDIKEKAAPETKKGDKFLNSKSFDTMLSLAENEPVIQAAMSAFICIGLRPITIMALPTKKDKQDNMYAASHSMCSGMMGLVSALIIAQPFKSSSSYMMKNMYESLKEETLQRLNPHLDITSIKDAAGKRLPMEKWKDIKGNKFCKEFKDVDKIPMFKMFNDISAESFKVFGADVDWASQKGKSFNEVVTRDGKSLYDSIDWTKVGIIIEKDGKDEARILIRDLDKEYFTGIIKDAEDGSEWSRLDVNSIFDGDKVKDFREWKDIDGKQWKLDLDSSYISSAYDTADYIPRISGKTRVEADGHVKYSTYMKNGKDGSLGTEITQDMVDADKRNEVHDKILTWLPDIISRPFVATGTIALIPLVLKNVFHIEKSKKPAKEPPVNATQTEEKSIESAKKEEIAFKGGRRLEPDSNEQQISFKAKPTGKGKPSLFEKLIVRPLARIYAKPLYESERTSRISDSLANIPGKMTAHMATLGSLLTSSVYIQQTLNKKDLDKNRRRTLAINQGLCFIIPTIMAYWVDNSINKWIKTKEYRYSGLQEQKIAIARRDGKTEEEIAKLQSTLGKKLRGVRILAGLATFSLIYRYVAPVIITPVANWIGDKINARNENKTSQDMVKKVDFNAAIKEDSGVERAEIAKRA